MRISDWSSDVCSSDRRSEHRSARWSVGALDQGVLAGGDPPFALPAHEDVEGDHGVADVDVGAVLVGGVGQLADYGHVLAEVAHVVDDVAGGLAGEGSGEQLAARLEDLVAALEHLAGDTDRPRVVGEGGGEGLRVAGVRSEEHTSELQSLM